MRKFLSAVLAATMITVLCTACQTRTMETDTNAEITGVTEPTTETVTEQPTEQPTEEEKNTHTLYFKDSTKSGDKAVATFYNSVDGKSKDVEMKKISDDNGVITFSCEGDCSVYNMAYVAYGNKKQTTEFAFNQCGSGWQQTEQGFLPYTEGEKTESSTDKTEDITLTFKGYDKIIHIWKPEDYDASAKEKYSTVYVLDADIAKSFAAEQVKGMMSVTNQKAIVVAVENNFARDYELLPAIGVSADEKRVGSDLSEMYDSMNGSEFAQFIADMLVPYVQEHYHVYTDARHTAITGFSLSGLESFYIAMEYPDIFGTLGAVSPSLWEFDEATWKTYLSKKTFDENAPFLYFYTGPAKLDTDPDVTDMYNRLKSMGYPTDKLVLHFNEKGTHNARYWCNTFAEFLTAMVFQHIRPLQQ